MTCRRSLLSAKPMNLRNGRSSFSGNLQNPPSYPKLRTRSSEHISNTDGMLMESRSGEIQEDPL